MTRGQEVDMVAYGRMAVLLAFSGLSGWSMWEVGYLGIWRAGLAGPGAMQILFDLFVACGFGAAWVVRDARERGVDPRPWVLLALPFGSLPLLTYVVVRDWLPVRSRSAVAG